MFSLQHATARVRGAGLATAALLLLAGHAVARVTTYQCMVQYGVRDQLLTRRVVLDDIKMEVTDSRVENGSAVAGYLWTQGTISGAHKLLTVVRSIGEGWEWGDGVTQNGLELNHFTLAAKNGQYTYSVAGQQIAVGVCVKAKK